MTKQIILNQTKSTMYFKFVYNRKTLKCVSKQEFIQLPWPCIELGGWLIKYEGCTRRVARDLVSLCKYRPQSLWTDLKQTWAGLQEVLKLYMDISVRVKHIDMKSLLSNSIDLLLCVLNFARNNDMVSAISLGYKIYTIITVITPEKIDFQPQGLEEIILSSISMLLPAPIIAVLKRMQLLSNTKILDDYSNLQTIFDIMCDLLTTCYNASKCIMPQCVVAAIAEMQSMSLKYMIVREINSLLSSYKKDPKLCVDPTFVRKVEEVNEKVNTHTGIIELSRKSNYVKVIIDKLTGLYKNVLSHKEFGRKEPSAFILEGPPGCGKSVLMNYLLQVLGEPTYTHIVKTTEDSKDFYDLYSNETVFNMDDVGQMGVSQWRTLINMVSCAKLPLPCAEVKLKNTKYFTSDAIICTTNSFMKLNGFVRADGISDPEALRRRGYVFDLSDVKFVDREYKGTIRFRYYDLRERRFIEGFSTDMINWLKEHNLTIQTSLTNPELDDLLSWMYFIITQYRKMKETQSIQNSLGNDKKRLQRIRDKYMYQGDVYEVLQPESYEEYLADLDTAYPFNQYRTEFPIEEQVDDQAMTWQLLIYDLYQSSLDVLKSGGSFVLKYASIFTIIPYFLYRMWKSYSGKKEMKSQNNQTNIIYDKVLKRENSNAHSYAYTLANQTYTIELVTPDNRKFQSLGLLSGHYIVLPAHNTLGGVHGFVSVYAHNNMARLIDNLDYKVVFQCFEEDVAVIELPRNIPSYWKNLGKAFRKVEKDATALAICALGLVANVNALVRSDLDDPIVYKNEIYNRGFKLNPRDTILYDMQESGLCGAVLCNSYGEVLGMHVAGNVTTDVGASVVWSHDVRSHIASILTEDTGFFSKYEVKNAIGESGFKINKRESVYTSNVSDLEVTPLYGVFPVTRGPANLSAGGRHTVKDAAKKSFSKTQDVNYAAFDFAKNCMRAYIEPYSVITENEVVKGNDMLAGLNKESSNGYGCLKSKTEYVNFEEGTLTESCKNMIKQLKNDIYNGRYNDEDWFWTECLKDEIRNTEKVEKPRTFRIARVTTQIMMKEIFGKMVSNIMKHRDMNEIMIGVNPYVEWDKMYKRLRDCSGVWAGDIGSYDGKMLPQVQSAMHDILLEKFDGTAEDKAMCSFLLRDMMNTTVVVNDDVLRTTHSMPSGSYLTAIGNSLVNRFYTLMWYYTNVPRPSFIDFTENVIDYVYGDDKLNGLKTPKYKKELNAITMCEFFNSIGMSFTTATKAEVVSPFETLHEVSFLKRYFRYHMNIGRVMCPLDLRTLESGLSWYNKKKDLDVVIRDKVATFQRELYLHEPSIFEEKCKVLFNFCEQNGVDYVKLPKSYLEYVYTNDSDALKALSWGGSKYL